MQIDDNAEWLEPDGLGGFASGTTSGIRTRRYHALLLTATTPPTGRMVLVNGAEVWLDTSAGSFALSSERYAPGVTHPDGTSRIVAFEREPWPSWELETPDGTRIRHEVVVQHGSPCAVLTWTVLRAHGPLTLRVRPFLSGRDYHALHHENAAFRFEPHLVSTGDAGSGRGDVTVRFAPYAGVPGVEIRANGEYRRSPAWYRNFLYQAERDRGLDDTEDLASPGEFVWAVAAPGDTAACIMRAGWDDAAASEGGVPVAADADAIRSAERSRRAAFPTPLDRAADAYLVERNTGQTIVAGYPWFTDWGRDTFIAIRGLCLATGRLREARDILLAWASAVSEGMLPNRFPDRGDAPEFNAVDASLWYAIAVHEFLAQAGTQPSLVSSGDARRLRGAVQAILEGHARGTRFGIRIDDDGLLAAGAPGVQLTWMDARVGDRVITPRTGKPVEIQALWLNALALAGANDPAWRDVFERGRTSFLDRFWIESAGHLADVVDVDHVPGTHDATFRPNQILAIGGLPVALLDGGRAKRVVDAVERRLLTPIGLRTLAPDDPAYVARYAGGPSARDAAYHQGTVWPWLLGPFVHAWLRVRGDTAAARREARARFLTPLLAHLDTAGLGHVSEIADADPPHTPRGCPFQAWSLGELIRLDRQLLAAPAPRQSPRPTVQTV